jgi:hypothetical protein
MKSVVPDLVSDAGREFLGGMTRNHPDFRWAEWVCGDVFERFAKKLIRDALEILPCFRSEE